MKKLSYLLLILYCSSGFAQTQFNTLQQCLDYGKQNNPLLKIESLNHEIAHERVRSSRSILLPQVKAFGTIDNNLSLPVSLVPAQFLGDNEGEYAKVKFGTQFTANYGAEASLSLISVSNWKNLKATSLAEEAAAYQVKDRELSLTEQIIVSYYYALLSRESTALSRDLVNSTDSLLDAAEIRFTNGFIELLEYNRVKSIYLESLQQLRESQGAFEKNINNLKSLCGLSDKDSLILTESIAQSVQHYKATDLETTVNSMPRHRMLSLRNSQAEEELKRQRAKTLPELSIYARYSRQAFRDQFNFFSSSDPWFDVAVTGIRAEWNLFSGFNRQSTIKQTNTQKQIALYELENYTTQAQKELDELNINHQVAVHGLEKATEHYQLNLINHRIAGEKYSQGIYSIDQYVTIYQETVRSQNQYLNKMANYLVYESIVNTRNALK